jgi:hypothetical protein
MHGERARVEKSARAPGRRLATSALLGAAHPVAALAVLLALVTLAPTPAAAAPGDAQAQNGLVFARRRDCVRAVPLLETAELARHRPLTAVALADCYVATGELLRGSELYHAVVADTPQRFWVRADYNAAKAAKRRADDVDRRIPTLRFEAAAPYDDLEVEVNGRPLPDPTVAKPFAPDVTLTIVARAAGRQELRSTVVLNEAERRVVVLRLAVDASAAKPGARGGPRPRAAAPTSWLGARYYGVILPRFVMNIVADGGRTLPVPGGAFTFTTQAGDAEVTVALGYLSYRMGWTPFKPHGEPDTEWEDDSSSLQALTATVDLMWRFPLDAAGDVAFRVGGAVGFGWMFLGDLYRVQTYPANGKPGDPSTYLLCQGPNNPRGTFRYCNALDKDATHYPGIPEPDWFHHGIRPLVFPWLVVPELGLSFRASSNVTIDVDTGVSISGFLTSLGFRVGL